MQIRFFMGDTSIIIIEMVNGRHGENHSGFVADIRAAEFALANLTLCQPVHAAAAGAGNGDEILPAVVVAYDLIHLLSVGQHDFAALVDVCVHEIVLLDHPVHLNANRLSRFARHLRDAVDRLHGVGSQNGVVLPEVCQQAGRTAMAEKASDADAESENASNQKSIAKRLIAGTSAVCNAVNQQTYTVKG